MIKRNSKIKYLFLFALLYSFASIAQTGMNFQGVARNSSGVILASQPITIRLSILQGTVTGNIEYQETKSLNTNAQGLFNLVIGDGTAASTTGNYNNINWQQSPKFVKIEMDANAGSNFTTLGTTQLQYVAYAYFANSVAAENIVGLVPVTRGGTGTSTLFDLKNNLQIDKVNNTADSLKPISKAVVSALLTKLNNADTIYLSNRINTKLNTTDTIGLIRLINSKFSTADTLSLSNRINLKMNQTDGLSALALKANTIDVSTALGAKENTNNKSTANDLGGLTPSDILFPTQKAVKEYVTANSASGGVVDGGITTIKLADGAVTSIKLSDLAVTDAKIATGISKSKVGLGNVENTALSTWAGSNNLTTVGTISTGIWSGTSIAITNGGTGATTAAAARSNLGLVIGTNVMPANATTADVSPSIDRNYVTDAQKSGVLSNTTGINTGDETVSSIKSKLGITTLSGSNTGDQTIVLTGDVRGSGTSNFTTTVNSVGGVSSSTISNFDSRIIANTNSITTNTADIATLNSNVTNKQIAYTNLTSIGNLTNATGYLKNNGSGTFAYTIPTKTDISLGNVENTALSTWAGSNNLTTVGTISTGIWSGTPVAITNGGTGASTAAAARSNLGLVIGTNVQAPLIAGTDYQTPLTAGSNYLVPNSNITAATKIKITYDAKGLVTGGADATTADIAPSTDRNYVTDAQKSGVLSNTTGINTGDETVSSIKTKLGITTISGVNTGDQVLPTLTSLGAVPNSRTITINGTSLDLSADRSYTVSGGLTLTDLATSNVKAKTFELTQPSSINSTSTTTLDLSTGNVLQVVLTVSTTLAFSNPKVGTYIIKIKQDATGNRSLTFPTIKWADAAVPTITPTANAVDLITLIYDGVDYYGSCLQNF
jgi:hypothetical protein